MTNETILIPQETKDIDIHKISLYATSVLEHPRSQIEKLKKSILTFGQPNPILIDRQWRVIAGAAVYQACLELNREQVTVIILEHLSEVECRAYAIADNQIAKDSGWDEDLLLEDLSQLHSFGVEINDLGFNFSDSDFELDLEPEPQPEPQPEPLNPIEVQPIEVPTPSIPEKHNKNEIKDNAQQKEVRQEKEEESYGSSIRESIELHRNPVSPQQEEIHLNRLTPDITPPIQQPQGQQSICCPRCGKEI